MAESDSLGASCETSVPGSTDSSQVGQSLGSGSTTTMSKNTAASYLVKKWEDDHEKEEKKFELGDDRSVASSITNQNSVTFGKPPLPPTGVAPGAMVVHSGDKPKKYYAREEGEWRKDRTWVSQRSLDRTARRLAEEEARRVQIARQEEEDTFINEKVAVKEEHVEAYFKKDDGVALINAVVEELRDLRKDEHKKAEDELYKLKRQDMVEGKNRYVGGGPCAADVRHVCLLAVGELRGASPRAKQVASAAEGQLAMPHKVVSQSRAFFALASLTKLFPGPPFLPLTLPSFLPSFARRYEEAKLRHEVKQVFDIFDGDASGQIGIDEFGDLMKELCIPMGKKELKKLVKELDDDGSGELDFDEFFVWYKENHKEQKETSFVSGLKLQAMSYVNASMGSTAKMEAKRILVSNDVKDVVILARHEFRQKHKPQFECMECNVAFIDKKSKREHDKNVEELHLKHKLMHDRATARHKLVDLARYRVTKGEAYPKFFVYGPERSERERSESERSGARRTRAKRPNTSEAK